MKVLRYFNSIAQNFLEDSPIWFIIERRITEAIKQRSTFDIYPASISNIKIPRDHQSTALSCPLLNIISGAIYSGVPHIENVLKSEVSLF